jgi:hypothetical protein
MSKLIYHARLAIHWKANPSLHSALVLAHLSVGLASVSKDMLDISKFLFEFNQILGFGVLFCKKLNLTFLNLALSFLTKLSKSFLKKFL